MDHCSHNSGGIAEEGANSKDYLSSTRWMHPAVYKAVVALTLWMLLAAWGFSGNGYAEFVLTVVSLLVLGAIGLQLVMWRISRRRRDPDAHGDQTSRLRDWLSGEFEIRRGRLKGSEAATEILVPVAAAAVGMTSLALVLHFAVGG
jgi:Na+/melibiose symporter-like transporter